MPKITKHIPEIERYIKKTAGALHHIEDAKCAESLRDAWEDFVGNFGKAIGKLISASDRDIRTKAWGHRLRNLSQKDDPGLVFLREARNTEVHGLTPFADFNEPIVEIGNGLIAVGGNSSVQIKNCSFNGIPTGPLNLSTLNGRIAELSGNPNPDLIIRERGAEIRLKAIISEEKNSEYPVPNGLGDHSLGGDDPAMLAKAGVHFLEEKMDEFKNLLA